MKLVLATDSLGMNVLYFSL